MKQCATCVEQWEREDNAKRKAKQQVKDAGDKKKTLFSWTFGRKKAKGSNRNNVRNSCLKEKANP